MIILERVKKKLHKLTNNIPKWPKYEAKILQEHSFLSPHNQHFVSNSLQKKHQSSFSLVDSLFNRYIKTNINKHFLSTKGTQLNYKQSEHLYSLSQRNQMNKNKSLLSEQEHAPQRDELQLTCWHNATALPPPPPAAPPPVPGLSINPLQYLREEPQRRVQTWEKKKRATKEQLHLNPLPGGLQYADVPLRLPSTVCVKRPKMNGHRIWDSNTQHRD